MGEHWSDLHNRRVYPRIADADILVNIDCATSGLDTLLLGSCQLADMTPSRVLRNPRGQ